MIEQLAEMPTYEAYKDSGVEWLGDIPAHWKVIRVKNVFRLVIEPSEKNNDHELLSIYTDIGVKPRKELEEKGNKASTTDGYWLVKKGDFIVNKLLAWMGAIGLSEYEGVTSPAYDILRQTKPIDGYFYHYLFRTKRCTSELKKHSRGIMEMRLRLYFDKFGVVEIPYPPKEEQTTIAVFLDRKNAQIDQAVAVKEQQIALLKERKQILIQNAVTRGLDPNVPMRDSGVEWIGEIPSHWKVKKMSHIAQIDSGATPDRSRQNFWNGEIPWIKTGEINYNEILETEEYITESGLRNSSTKLSPKGTLLMAMYGQGVTRGRVALLGVPATYNQACCGIQFNNLFIVKFAFYFFIAAYSYIRDDGNETSQMNLSTGYISTLKILCPSWEEQTAIVAHIETQSAKIDQAISIQQQQIDKLKEYKATLINSAVTGKIKVPELVESKDAA